jgi:glycosyltransferase involved in cell wall biosynthesis
LPAISVIVPIYNVEQYLHKCLDSILAQTFKDFELILVDDGSPDKCGEICEYYANKDNRIHVIHKINGGVSSARNRGIDIARGEYIAFVDPDDTIEPTMYDVLFQTALNHRADIVVCSYKTIDLVNNSTTISPVWRNVDCIIDKNTIETYVLPLVLIDKTYSLISSWNKLYRKSMFDSLNIRFDEKKHFGEDERLNITLLSLINNLVCVDQPLYNYFIRKRDSLTSVLKEDLYEAYVLDIKKYKIELCNKYNLREYIDSIRNYYTGVTLSHMQDVVSRNISTIRKYNILSTILNNKEFIEDILSYEVTTRYGKFLRYSCILRNEKLLLYVIKFRIKLQQYINRIS